MFRRLHRQNSPCHSLFTAAPGAPSSFSSHSTFNFEPFTSSSPTFPHLSPLFPFASKLFCTHQKLISFVFSQIQTLFQNHPGWGAAASKWDTRSTQMRWRSGSSVLHSELKYNAPEAIGEHHSPLRIFTLVSIVRRRGAGGSAGLIPLWATTHRRSA